MASCCSGVKGGAADEVEDADTDDAATAEDDGNAAELDPRPDDAYSSRSAAAGADDPPVLDAAAPGRFLDACAEIEM